MRMSTPYVGRPNDYGILTMTQEEIDAAVDDARPPRLPDRHPRQRRRGDRHGPQGLRAREGARAASRTVRPRIEHCSLVTPDLLARIKKVGAIPTPFYTYVHYHGDKWAEYGDEKMRSMFAHAWFLERGIPVARGLGLHSRPLRAADGAPEHGDAEGLSRAGVGRQPADHARPGAAGLHDQRRRTPRSRSARRARSRPASSRTSWCSRRTRTTWTRTRSRTSAWFGPSWAERRFTASTSDEERCA